MKNRKSISNEDVVEQFDPIDLTDQNIYRRGDYST